MAHLLGALVFGDREPTETQQAALLVFAGALDDLKKTRSFIELYMEALAKEGKKKRSGPGGGRHSPRRRR